MNFHRRLLVLLAISLQFLKKSVVDFIGENLRSHKIKVRVSSKETDMKEGGRKQGLASPCAACKLLRRRCAQDCLFAPYFPAEEPHKFANVHKVFGASNVNKMLQDLPEDQRGDAVSSMVYEANARVRDPVYGCVGAISVLQQQIESLQKQLALAQAEVVYMKMNQQPLMSSSPPVPTTNLTTVTNSESENASPRPSSGDFGLVSCNDSQSSMSYYSMDMAAVDFHTNMGESLWSC